MTINYCRDQVNNNLIELKSIPSRLNDADVLSKPLFAKDFQYKSQRIQGVQFDETPLLPPTK